MMETPVYDIFLQAEEFLRKMEEEGANPFSRATIMEPWISDFVDVPSIHHQATKEIEKLISRVKKEERSKARLLIGDSANGKSHILARTKNRFSDKAFFCFVEPLTGDGDNIFQHILSNMVRDLFRFVPGSNQPQFHRVWRDFFLGVAGDKSEHMLNFRAWIESRKYDFVCLVDSQLKATGKTIEPSLIGVLYEYVKNYTKDTRIRLIIENWLRARPLSEKELRLMDFPFRSSIDTEDKAKEMINALGLVTFFSRPIFLCFDQVEAYILNDRAFKAFMRAVEYIVEFTHNYAVVTAALLTFDEKLRTSGLTPSTWDRFNYTSDPIVIHPLTPGEGEKLIKARLVGDVGDLRICAEKPLFPFCSEDLDVILTPAGATTRTDKQARYILEDAERVFDDIVERRPAASFIEQYFDDDVPLRKAPMETQATREWPATDDVESYLAERVEALLLQYESDRAEAEIDEKRNRRMVLDLLFKAIASGTGKSRFEVADLTVYQARNPEGCDFTLTVERGEGKRYSVGVIFCDDTRANVIRSVIGKATRVLQSEAIDELIYVRDSRAVPTKKSQDVLKQFRRDFSEGSPRVVMSNVDPENLKRLRTVNRLLEFAGNGDLVMRNAGREIDYTVQQNDVWDYLLQDECLLLDGVVSTIITGRSQSRS